MQKGAEPVHLVLNKRSMLHPRWPGDAKALQARCKSEAPAVHPGCKLPECTADSPVIRGRCGPPAPAVHCRCNRDANDRWSGDDVGRQVVFQHRDLVAQHQLATLESGNLQLVGTARRRQRGNRRIKVAMLDPQGCQPPAHLLFVHRNPLILARTHSATRCTASTARFNAAHVCWGPYIVI